VSRDEQQLNLLATFHYVLAGLVALFSCVFLFHIVAGVVMLFADDGPPKLIGLLFLLIPGALILAFWALAALILTAGLRLRDRRTWTFCLVIAGIECVFVPLGTILGVFTILVLNRDSVQRLFGGSAGPGVGIPPITNPQHSNIPRTT
jgi:hypothetical protein